MNKAIRILVVDDDSQIRSLLCDCLADFGMTTAQAGTGAEMHLALGEGGFDLVVVGSKGRGAVSRVLIGSVTDRLVHICKRPILVVR